MASALAISLLSLLLLRPSNASTPTSVNGKRRPTTCNFIGSVGGVVDCSTRVGREEKVAMELAVEDFCTSTGYGLALKLRDLSGKTAGTVSAVFDLIKHQQVQAVVGTLTTQEAAVVAEMDETNSRVPLISLDTASITPSVMPVDMLPVIHMGHGISVEMRCIAAIVGFFQWQKVIAIFEDKFSYGRDLGIITLLSETLRGVGAEMEHYLAFPSMSSLLDPKTTIQEELKRLRDKQGRVFIVVQSSSQFTALLFEQAMQMELMVKGNVWITTNFITSLLDSFHSSVITSMEGVLGFRTYFLDTSASFKNFKARFRRKFLSEYHEEEENIEPSVFALRAYDAVWAIAKAIERLPENSKSKILLPTILSSNFRGLSTEIRFMNYKLVHAPAFQIVNVVGKSYREMGYWSPKFGFSRTMFKDDGAERQRNSSTSAEDVLGSVYWPGGKTSVPVRLMETTLSGRQKPLRIGVPVRSNFTQYVKVIQDENGTYFSGFSLDVFDAVTKLLPYQLPYEWIPFNGTYDKLVEAVNQKALDAAVGDMQITSDWCKLTEFSQPYVESGLVIVVPVNSNESQEPWMFMRPFTWGLWSLMAAMSVFTGVVVWFIEHRSNEDFRGPRLQQIGKVLWFSFTTLYLGQSLCWPHGCS
ncbi:glutamate receptor 3.2-like isoform X2 [Malania oleifera]|uniref:glutamate receptor 3.2-like isoform X2 n=1 Tax=Malania oleifera TaxID=397392 RepID=UPI0025AE0EC7|nr:glutamate receptor 3.2-like isoform X2 [Malania oleifera]